MVSPTPTQYNLAMVTFASRLPMHSPSLLRKWFTLGATSQASSRRLVYHWPSADMVATPCVVRVFLSLSCGELLLIGIGLVWGGGTCLVTFLLPLRLARGYGGARTAGWRSAVIRVVWLTVWGLSFAWGASKVRRNGGGGNDVWVFIGYIAAIFYHYIFITIGCHILRGSFFRTHHSCCLLLNICRSRLGLLASLQHNRQLLLLRWGELLQIRCGFRMRVVVSLLSRFGWHFVEW